MAKGKNTPKKESFMDELEESKNETEEIEEAEEEAKEPDSSGQPVKSRKGLSSVPMSLKRIRKIIEDVDLNDISVVDKFDLRMASNYIDFLKETIDNMLKPIK